ncbi:MAG: response regulator transcription factor [Ignavibacteria bacterium]|nr:response regulator transcription factor [Ignavibacteria bacterium]
MKKISVVIVEDEDEIRSGITELINLASDIECTGSFNNGLEAFQQIPSLPVDVVLMDIQMPKMNGIECIRRLKDELPDLQIMMLTVYEDEDKIFESLKAGATGYLLKNTAPIKLLDAIRELAHGGAPMSGSIARKVVSTFSISKNNSGNDELSKREAEILEYCAKGYRYKEIADKLFISVETVRTHIHRIYEKLHVRSRTEAVVKFLKK